MSEKWPWHSLSGAAHLIFAHHKCHSGSGWKGIYLPTGQQSWFHTKAVVVCKIEVCGQQHILCYLHLWLRRYAFCKFVIKDSIRTPLANTYICLFWLIVVSYLVVVSVFFVERERAHSQIDGERVSVVFLSVGWAGNVEDRRRPQTDHRCGTTARPRKEGTQSPERGLDL